MPELWIHGHSKGTRKTLDLHFNLVNDKEAK